MRTPSGGSGPDLVGRLLTTRSLVRAPILLYRARLGFLLGPRVLMLEHVGRTSGRTRYVCLEAVDRPAPHTIIVVSGFGERAQWLRNLRAHPRCRVSTGLRHARPAVARELSPAEADAALARYAREHPRAWARLRDGIASTGAAVDHLPMMELRLS